MSDDWDDNSDECRQWTFYKFSTIKGSVTIRWVGITESCYSLSVNFEEISENN